MKNGKVQTNDYGVNVLVEHEDSNSHHYSHLDFAVTCEKMSDEEIDLEFSKIILSKSDKIDMLKKIEGFATSNVRGANDEFDYSDLFKYEKVKK